MHSFGAIVFSIILSLFLRPAALASPVVKIGHTTLVGRDVTGLKQDFFGGKEQFFDWTTASFFFIDFETGIPFATPPLGQLRLKPPVRLAELPAGNFSADHFGFACLQPVGRVPFALQHVSMSEDCLTINVFRPSGVKPDAKLPVVSRLSSYLTTHLSAQRTPHLKVVLDVS
jgi:hypothetical protein